MRRNFDSMQRSLLGLLLVTMLALTGCMSAAAGGVPAPNDGAWDAKYCPGSSGRK